MLEISSILSKPVMSQDDASIIGSIKNVYFEYDCKKIAYFLLSIDNDGDRLLPFESVTSFSDAVTVQNKTTLKYVADADITSLVTDICDMPVYTQNGDSKGSVQKVEFLPSGKVTKFIAQNFQFAPSSISKVGNVVVLKSAPKQIKRKKQEIPRPQNDYPVYILDNPVKLSPEALQSSASSALLTDAKADENISKSADAVKNVPTFTQNALLQDAPPSIMLSQDSREPMFTKDAFESLIGSTYQTEEEEDCHTPTRIICNYDFLLDRILGADLYTYGGELIAKKGSKVTNDTLQQARRAGKLVELTINSVNL